MAKRKSSHQMPMVLPQFAAMSLICFEGRLGLVFQWPVWGVKQKVHERLLVEC